MRNQNGIFRWDSEVRANELDIQGIVNNANYFCYFDHVRTKYLLELGVDWSDWHLKGYDIVLAHVDMTFKASLRPHDKFYVTTRFKKKGKLKILCEQNIYKKPDDLLIAESVNTVVCISSKTSKPVFPDELENLLFHYD